MKSILHLKDRFFNYVSDSCEKIFFRDKLNNWVGYLIVAAIAVVFGYLLATSPQMGLGLFGLVVALFFIIICITNTEAGFYVTVIFSYFSFHIDRFFFRATLPLGVLFDVLIFVSFLSLFITKQQLRKTFQKFIKEPVIVCILALLFFLFIELFNPSARSFDGWFQAFRKFLDSVLLLFICYNVFTSYSQIRRFIITLFVISTLAGLYACIQEWHGLFGFELAWILSNEHGLGLIFIDGEFRKFSVFSDPASSGIILAASALFFLVLSTARSPILPRYMLIIGTIFMLLGMSYSGTRTANAMVAVGLVIYLLLGFDKKGTRVLALCAGLVFLVLMYAPIPVNKTITRFRSTFQAKDDASYNVRLLNRAYVQPYLLSHPIGGGLGTTGAAGAVHNPGHYLADFQTDSGYLKKAAETGWIGLAIICILYFNVLKYGIRGFFRSRNDNIKLYYAACVVAIFAFYVGDFAQEAIGQITDVVVYYPMLILILKMKDSDEESTPEFLKISKYEAN